MHPPLQLRLKGWHKSLFFSVTMHLTILQNACGIMNSCKFLIFRLLVDTNSKTLSRSTCIQEFLKSEGLGSKFK